MAYDEPYVRLLAFRPAHRWKHHGRRFWEDDDNAVRSKGQLFTITLCTTWTNPFTKPASKSIEVLWLLNALTRRSMRGKWVLACRVLCAWSHAVHNLHRCMLFPAVFVVRICLLWHSSTNTLNDSLPFLVRNGLRRETPSSVAGSIV